MFTHVFGHVFIHTCTYVNTCFEVIYWVHLDIPIYKIFPTPHISKNTPKTPIFRSLFYRLRKRLPELDPCSLTPEIPICYCPHLVNTPSPELPISGTPHFVPSPSLTCSPSHSVLCIVYSVLFILYSALCNVYYVLCVLCTLNCVV